MKFIHIADVHWGARPEREQTFGRIREQEIKETFQRVIDHANKQQVDLLLIAGDLFDQPPTQQELREVDYLLSRLNHTRTVLIAGNHDHLEPHDVFSQYKWNSEVYLLDGKQRDHISFEDLETTIYGFSYWKNQISILQILVSSVIFVTFPVLRFNFAIHSFCMISSFLFI